MHVSDVTQPNRPRGVRNGDDIWKIAGPKASAYRQLNAPLEPASLPFVFYPLDRNFGIAFLHGPAATSATERHLRDKNTFRLY
jgi:hypothetical protein